MDKRDKISISISLAAVALSVLSMYWSWQAAKTWERARSIYAAIKADRGE